MSLSFAITNSEEFYKKLKEDYISFINDRLSSSKAINFAMAAYHIAEWVYYEYEEPKGTDTKTFKTKLNTLCPHLQIMKDISNGSKHFKIMKYPSKTKSTTQHDGDFNDDFSFDFDVSYLEIEMVNGTKYYYENVVKEVMLFWENYLLKTYLIKTI